MKTRTATCSCGRLHVTAQGEPIRVSVCHCLACQKRSGSAFAAQARFPKDRVTFEGETRVWHRTGDEGGGADFRFCPTCGSTVWYTLAEVPDVVAIAVGAFADPSFPAPVFSVYEVRRHPWVTLPDDMEKWD